MSRSSSSKSGPPTSRDEESQKKRMAAGSPLTKYFMLVLFGFSSLSIFANNKFANTVHLREDSNVVGSVLKNFHVSNTHKKEVEKQMEKIKMIEEMGGTSTDMPEDGDSNNNHEQNPDDDDDDEFPYDEENDTPKGDTADDDEGNKSHQQQKHTIANLKCDAYGGPSDEDVAEMVYWEDIPKDATHISPFHMEYRQNKKDGDVQQITQFLTFEPDNGGWNNIRMAMETVLALAFSMGRTLVLPPHQGMYLIDKGGDSQKNKFSFDHFFHMESISNEHIGLNIITTKDFLEQCVSGKIVDTDNKPIYPPGMRTDWDGAPRNELRELKEWIRKYSGQSLSHWDPDRCIAAFPASNSEQDAKDLESLPSEINKLPGKFPNYDKYIGKPNDVDAPAIERLKEMNADREELCTYTPELQQTQWLHFPVSETSRLLVHFYAFLFFQDWKHDLWMKRFVRDHVRYIDEIQCAAARVVTALRKRVSDRTKGASKDFDTIHIRRGDFQFKETRVDAKEILEQLKKVLDDTTTLYIATDERDKSFFKDIVNHYPDVVFLDDMLSEVEGVNTNYYGMIDQLVASRGKTFFGCWFSTFTGYINRLRGYHTDDHELPGYEKGIVPSYYYAMSEHFDRMQEFWPIKRQFYAREFPASWRLIDSSL